MPSTHVLDFQAYVLEFILINLITIMDKHYSVGLYIRTHICTYYCTYMCLLACWYIRTMYAYIYVHIHIRNFMRVRKCG